MLEVTNTLTNRKEETTPADHSTQHLTAWHSLAFLRVMSNMKARKREGG